VALDQLLDLGDLGIEELDVAHARLDRLALLDRKLQLPQPLTALDSEAPSSRNGLPSYVPQKAPIPIAGA
jgi:hypothetical protein